MDAFFASVEQRDHPEWRGKPVVVGAPPDRRGVVAAASYEARTYGIHSAMPSREAGRLCPHAVFVPANGRRYRQVSARIFRILERFSPFVEPLSIDEAFLDVTGVQRLFGKGEEIAAKIKQAIRRETGLTASIGVAPNKFLAKLASDLQKPDGLTVVPDDRAAILEFLAPLPVHRIWGVGKVMERQLQRLGIETIGDLQTTPPQRLAGLLGKRTAEHLLRLAHGQDNREIEPAAEEKSMSGEHTFPEDTRSPEQIERVLCDLAETVGRRLRSAGLYARAAHLKLRWKDFRTITRQKALARPCRDDFTLRQTALGLFRAQETKEPVRLIGFGVSRLIDHADDQMSLFETESRNAGRNERLSQAVDRLRGKYGDTAIGRAPTPPARGSSGPQE